MTEGMEPQTGTVRKVAVARVSDGDTTRDDPTGLAPCHTSTTVAAR